MKIRPLKAVGLGLLLVSIVLYTSVFHTKTVALNGIVGPDRTAALILKVLREAKWTDHVIISVDSPGGYVFVETMIADAIANSHAYLVTADIPAEGDSAAAMISMDCDQVIMDPMAVLGFHFGEVGSVSDLAHAVVLTANTVNSTNPQVAQATKDSIAELKALPLWLFNDNDWVIMNSGNITYISGKDMTSRMPMFYTLEHAYARDMRNISIALLADKDFQDYITSLHAELSAIYSVI